MSQKEQITTDITIELLTADGWVKPEGNDGIGIYFEKKLPNRNFLNNTPEDSDISLILHGMYNSQNFAVQLPNGAMLNFIANSMAELKSFEKALYFYDPEY